MDLTFALEEQPFADARVTWAVIHNGYVVGRVSEDGHGHWSVSDAGFAVRPPRGNFRSRDEAAGAIVGARAHAPLLHRGASGMRRLNEAILIAERRFVTEPQPGERERIAADLDISMPNYRQVLRSLREDPYAYAFDPATVIRLRERHIAATVRTARLRRDSASLAAAS